MNPRDAWKEGWLKMAFWTMNGGLFAMCVETEAQQIGDAQERLLCAPVAERHEFGAPVACELRGQAVGPLCVCEERGVLCARKLHLGGAPILQRIERDVFEPAAHLRAQARIERGVEREQKLQLRVGAQPRRLIDVHAALLCHVVIDRATEEVGQVEAREGEQNASFQPPAAVSITGRKRTEWPAGVKSKKQLLTRSPPDRIPVYEKTGFVGIRAA